MFKNKVTDDRADELYEGESTFNIWLLCLSNKGTLILCPPIIYKDKPNSI